MPNINYIYNRFLYKKAVLNERAVTARTVVGSPNKRVRKRFIHAAVMNGAVLKVRFLLMILSPTTHRIQTQAQLI